MKQLEVPRYLLLLTDMASAEPDLQPTTEPNSLPAEAEQAFVLEDPLPEPALHEQASQTEEPPSPCRPLRIYTRSQMLFLHGSPLVKPPPDMPELKHWFGYVLSPRG